MKQCTKCKQVKSLTEFHKWKNGYKPSCKSCRKEESKIHYQNNKEYYSKQRKEYANKNKDKINEIARIYYSNNKDKCNARSKKWQDKNKDHIRQYTKSRSKERKSLDPLFKLTCKVRSDIHKILNRKQKSTHNYIGCNYDVLLNWLNNNQYGFKYGDKNIDVDHIVPLSSAKNDEELSFLLHYTNLQLLPSYYNRHVKKDKIFNKKEFNEWMKTEV